MDLFEMNIANSVRYSKTGYIDIDEASANTLLEAYRTASRIVLCGNCMYGRLVGSGFCECTKNGGTHYHDWFCADGEKRKIGEDYSHDEKHGDCETFAGQREVPVLRAEEY